MAGGVVALFRLLLRWADCDLSTIEGRVSPAAVVSYFHAYDTSRPMLQEREALTTLV
jgi:hypothetical protein